MNIITVYNIGDTTWVIQNSRAVKIEITSIHIGRDKAVRYGSGECGPFLEDECFGTKEELLKYVAGE